MSHRHLPQSHRVCIVQSDKTTITGLKNKLQSRLNTHTHTRFFGSSGCQQETENGCTSTTHFLSNFISCAANYVLLIRDIKEQRLSSSLGQEHIVLLIAAPSTGFINSFGQDLQKKKSKLALSLPCIASKP